MKILPCRVAASHYFLLLLSTLSLSGLIGCNGKTEESPANDKPPASDTSSTSDNSSASDTIDISRVVCVSKQLNEIIYALGAADHLVGVDLTSIYPPAAKNLPRVGYHRHLSPEGIIALRPTVLIHDGNVGPQGVLEQVSAVGIPVKEFREGRTIDGTKDLIGSLGKVFNATTRADSLCTKLDADMKLALEKKNAYPSRPKVILIHFGQLNNSYLVVGQKSVASQMVDWAGGINSASAAEGMKPLSPEIIAQAQPDVILATDVGYDKMGGVENFKKLPGLALTPAARNNRIYRVEEHDIIYLGPGTGENILKLMQLIHGK